MAHNSQVCGLSLGNAVFMRAVPVVLFAATLIACRGDSPTAERALPEDVVLVDAPITLGPRPLPIRLNPPLESGGEVLVCLVLASGVRYDNRDRIDTRYADLLNGARPVALLHSGGKGYRLTEARQGWTEYGRVSPGGELSSCLSAEAAQLPDGREIDLIELTADMPLEILGAYWSSTQPLG